MSEYEARCLSVQLNKRRPHTCDQSLPQRCLKIYIQYCCSPYRSSDTSGSAIIMVLAIDKLSNNYLPTITVPNCKCQRRTRRYRTSQILACPQPRAPNPNLPFMENIVFEQRFGPPRRKPKWFVLFNNDLTGFCSTK